MTTQIRRAIPDDAAAIAGVHVRAWQAAYRGLMPDAVLDGLSVARRERTWRQLLTCHELTAVHLADDGTTVVGFCAVAAPSRDDDADDVVAQVSAIYIEPRAWRTGVGRALLERALTDLRAGGWHSVTLWVLAANRPARDFYARFGFAPDGAEATHERSGAKEVRLHARLIA